MTSDPNTLDLKAAREAFLRADLEMQRAMSALRKGRAAGAVARFDKAHAAAKAARDAYRAAREAAR